MHSWTLYTDGGARGNPGPAGIGGALFRDDECIDSFSDYIGTSTNNIAEYSALNKGLRLALRHGVKSLICRLDSELIVKQMNGEYRVKNEQLKALATEAKDLLESFASVTFTHIRRDQNTRADTLVNEALDKHAKS